MGMKFFEKNKIDLDLGDQVTITVTDGVATNSGQDFVDNLRNRRNDSGWATTDSTDAGNTTLIVEFGDLVEFDRLIILQHNWKAYTIKRWNGSSYVDFSTPINVSGNTLINKLHEFSAVEAEKIQIVITQTMLADDDKQAAQLIVTRFIGEFVMQPKISDIRIGKNRKSLKALSGKIKVMRSSGAVDLKLQQKSVVSDADLDLLELLHDYHQGFLMWICGGNTEQFRNQRIGYREHDFYLVNITSEYQPEWHEGFFRQGIDVEFRLAEAI